MMFKIGKIHYGWVVVAGAFLATAVCGGVFFQPLQDEFGWTRATTASVNTVWLIGFAVSGYFMGWLTDVRGPRFALLLGAVLTGAGYALSSRAGSLRDFYLAYVRILISKTIGGNQYATEEPESKVNFRRKAKGTIE